MLLDNGQINGLILKNKFKTAPLKP